MPLGQKEKKQLGIIIGGVIIILIILPLQLKGTKKPKMPAAKTPPAAAKNTTETKQITDKNSKSETSNTNLTNPVNLTIKDKNKSALLNEQKNSLNLGWGKDPFYTVIDTVETVNQNTENINSESGNSVKNTPQNNMPKLTGISLIGTSYIAVIDRQLLKEGQPSKNNDFFVKKITKNEVVISKKGNEYKLHLIK